jgi:hypothetical protein
MGSSQRLSHPDRLGSLSGENEGSVFRVKCHGFLYHRDRDNGHGLHRKDRFRRNRYLHFFGAFEPFRFFPVYSPIPANNGPLCIPNTKSSPGLREQKKAAGRRPFMEHPGGYFFFSAFFFFGSNTFRPS